MKTFILILLVFCCSSGAVWAQSDIVFFSERGEKFYVILNGLKYNDTPQTNVRIENLNGDYFKAKVIFEDKALGEVNGNVMLERFKETTYAVKFVGTKGKTSSYAIRFYSVAPRRNSTPDPVAKDVPPPSNTPPPPPSNTPPPLPANPPASENVNVDVNVNTPMGGFGISVRTNDTGIPPPPTGQNQPPPIGQNQPPPVYVPGYSGRIGCPMPMNPATFSQAKATIAKNSFEDTKLTIAKQVIKSNCLTANQVKEICELFTFEDSKLDFAKYAYRLTYDIENYFIVNQVFTFESSTEDLAEYIDSAGSRY